MKTIKLSNEKVNKLSNATVYSFPKYTTQIINLVNQNAGGTRPAVVGQMSELIQEFDGNSLEEWIAWYEENNPGAIEDATKKIYDMYLNMRAAFDLINEDLIRDWVKDLVHNKTYCGLKFQGAIMAVIAEKYKKNWRLASPTEEAKGIDGYIGNQAVQIKSSTYKTEQRLPENITVPIIFYDKKKDGIVVEYDETLFVGE